MSNSTERADKEALKDAISNIPDVPDQQRDDLLAAVDRGEIKTPAASADYVEVIITQDPPVGTWCFGMKGRTFKVIDRGGYYLLLADVDLLQKRRCLAKDVVSVID